MPQVHEDIAEWERRAGFEPTPAGTLAADPTPALEHMERCGIQAHLLDAQQHPGQFVCLFDLDGQLYVTRPADTEADAAALALDHVIAKSALT